MEVGLAGVLGLAVISVVVVDAPYGLVPAPVLHPRMVGRSVKERRTRSSPATPNPVVRQTQRVHTRLLSLDRFDPKVCKNESSLIQYMDIFLGKALF